MIDLMQIDEKRIDNFKGGKGYIYMRNYEDDDMKIALINVPSHCSIGYHSHENGFEVIRIIKGRATVILDNKKELLKEGQINYCPKGHSHSVTNETLDDLILYCLIKK